MMVRYSVTLAEGMIVQVQSRLETQTFNYCRNIEGKVREVKTEPERETGQGYKVVFWVSKFRELLACRWLL